MTSNSLPSFSKDVHYSYLLFRKDGSIPPLPPRVTVLPLLCAVDEVTSVGEIASSSFSGLPFLESGPAGKTKGAAATEEETTSSSVPQFRLAAYLLYASSSCSSSSSSMVDHLHDAVQTRVLFPDVSSPLESSGESTTFASSPPKSSPFYVPPHSKNVAAPSATQVCLQAPTYEPLFCVSSGLGPHPTHLCSERCPWSASCHDPPALESCGPPVLEPNSERDDVNANKDNPAIAIDSVSSAKGNTATGGGKNSIGDNADFKGKERGEKLESTEFCTYFHRRVGCKRGRDCFYAHGSAGEKYAPIKKFVLTTNSSEKLEGKWRRNEPQCPNAARGKEAVEGVIADRKVNFSEITCRTPGHTLSTTNPAKHIKTHCTFFLRFGECDYWPACKFSHESPDRTRMWRGSRLPSRLKLVGGGSSAEKVSIEHGSKAGEAVELKNIPEGDSQSSLRVGDD